MECKMTNTIQLTTHTYYVHLHCMIFPVWHTLQPNEPTQKQNPPISLLRTFLYNVTHLQLHECHSLIMVRKNAIKQWLSPLIMLFLIHTLQTLNHCIKPLKNMHRKCMLIRLKTNTCIIQTIPPLLTYPLCLSRKGCRARGKTKANHGV